jgi:hypothetical protein
VRKDVRAGPLWLCSDPAFLDTPFRIGCRLQSCFGQGVYIHICVSRGPSSPMTRIARHGRYVCSTLTATNEHVECVVPCFTTWQLRHIDQGHGAGCSLSARWALYIYIRKYVCIYVMDLEGIGVDPLSVSEGSCNDWHKHQAMTA